VNYLLIGLLLTVFCTPPDGRKPYELSGFAQGTSYHITYYASDSLFTQYQADSVFASLDSSLSLYKPYSLVNAFNRATGSLVMDAHLQRVVSRALEVYKVTAGAFDITVWPLVTAWGFGLQRVSSLPDSAGIAAIMPCIGSDKLRVNGNILHKQSPCLQLDVNGIAQGYTVDVLAAMMEARGITDYMIEVGGEISMKGRKPGNKKMSIGIEGPGDTPFEASLIKKVIYPDSGAVTTSGSYRKFYESNGRHITHLLDPRTGYSVSNGLVSVTVFAKDAMTADAYDNALMVMGLEHAMRFANRNKEIEAYFIYRSKQGIISDTATAGFYRLMQN
jgi:FAD:protein FMN transferase